MKPVRNGCHLSRNHARMKSIRVVAKKIAVAEISSGLLVHPWYAFSLHKCRFVGLQ